MRGFSRRLSTRIVLIVLLVLLPAIAIFVYDQTNDRRRAREDAVENAGRLARLAAREQARIFEGVERLLGTLALFPALKNGDASSCNALLPDLLRGHPHYINIFALNADGSRFCVAANPGDRVLKGPQKESAWFTRVMQTRAPSIGDYQISLITGRPAVILAHPITDASGNITRVVAAIIRLDEMSAAFQAVNLPRGATLTLTDRQGTILARVPSAPALIGTRHAQFPTTRPAGSVEARTAMLESTGSDGVKRLYTVIPVAAGSPTGFYVTLDVESATIFADADRALYTHLSLLALVALIGLVVAVVGGRALVLQPVVAHQRETEDRLRFALEVSKVGVWQAEVTPGGEQRVYWSETLETMHGLAPGAFGGRFDDFLNCVRPDDREPVIAKIREAQAERRDVDIEYRTVWPDGTERRLTTTGHYTFNANGEFARGAGVTIDVTDRRSLEEQLRQAQKMEAIGRLAGGIAHDFNNMLTVILGNARVLWPTNSRAAIAAATTWTRSRRPATRASSPHAATARVQPQAGSAPKVLHLDDVVAEHAQHAAPAASARHRVDLRSTTRDRHDVKADPGQIEQVIMNLVVNARDAMPNGGRLTIETANVVMDDDSSERIGHDPRRIRAC